MKFLKNSLFSTLVVGICLFGRGFAQSLAEKFESANDLIRQSKSKIEAGYYQEGFELAEQAKTVLPEIRVLMELNKLNHNIKMGRLLKAEENAPEDFAAAVQHQGFAAKLLSQKSYDPALEEIRNGQAAIARAINISREKIQKKMDHKKDQFGGTSPEISVKKSKSGTYLVQLRPRKRDCLWRIASYAEIYGDGWLWTKLYEANREIIKNPHLIYPGQKLFIPPKEFTIQEIRNINKSDYSSEEQQVKDDSVISPEKVDQQQRVDQKVSKNDSIKNQNK